MSFIERKNAPQPNETKAAIDALGATVQDIAKGLSSRMDELEKVMNRPRMGGGNGKAADLGAEHKALGTLVRTGDDAELKSLQVGIQPDGGFLVTPALSTSMTKKIFDLSPMRRLARVETITIGDAFEEPIDFDQSGATWVGENSSRPATTTPQLKMLHVPVHEIYALQPVTQRLLDDANFDVGAWVEGKIADKFAREEATACVTGDGMTKPMGFMNLSTSTADDSTRPWWTLQYTKSGSASVIADANGGANGIVDLYWALRAPYRANATWLMASSTANALDKLKDSTQNYIWRAGMTSGAPPSLLGRPVEICEDMPAIGANAFPVAFGDFRQAYLIVDKVGVRYLRDPFTSKPSLLFYGYRRTGGNVANSEAVKLLKIST